MFNYILVKLSDEFKNELKKEYMKNKHWMKVLSTISDDQTDDETLKSVKKVSFIKINELLYFMKNDSKQRLCILKSMKKKIFKLKHDDWSHAEYHHCYKHISEVIYI